MPQDAVFRLLAVDARKQIKPFVFLLHGKTGAVAGLPKTEIPLRKGCTKQRTSGEADAREAALHQCVNDLMRRHFVVLGECADRLAVIACADRYDRQTAPPQAAEQRLVDVAERQDPADARLLNAPLCALRVIAELLRLGRDHAEFVRGRIAHKNTIEFGVGIAVASVPLCRDQTQALLGCGRLELPTVAHLLRCPADALPRRRADTACPLRNLLECYFHFCSFSGFFLCPPFACRPFPLL